MKDFDYPLNDSDIKTLLTTLTVMLETFPLLSLDELSPQDKINCVTYGSSAIERLANVEERISRNELSAIHISLQIADMINCKELVVDEYSTQLCNSNAFAITKLLSVFDNYFD